MMTESNVTTLISGVCRDAGKSKGVEFHPPAAWGAQVPGRWEVSCRLKRQGWSVTLTYWLSPNSLVSEEVVWSFGAPARSEQTEQFKRDLSTKLDLMLAWVKRE
jgi:hypothetical protein